MYPVTYMDFSVPVDDSECSVLAISALFSPALGKISYNKMMSVVLLKALNLQRVYHVQLAVAISPLYYIFCKVKTVWSI